MEFMGILKEALQYIEPSVGNNLTITFNFQSH